MTDSSIFSNACGDEWTILDSRHAVALSMRRRCLPEVGCFGANVAGPGGRTGRGGGAGRVGRFGTGRTLPVSPRGLGLGVK